MAARFPLEGRTFRDAFERSVNARADHADLRNRDKRPVESYILRHPKARRVDLARFEFGKTLLLVALPRTAKEVLIGAIEIAQRLLQRLGVHLPQPCRFGLVLQSGEFGRQVRKRKRFARFAVVIARAVQSPIPDESPRTRKLVQQLFLRGSRVKSVAIGCLNRSLHGAIIHEKAGYYKRFRASGRHICTRCYRSRRPTLPCVSSMRRASIHPHGLKSGGTLEGSW